MEKEQVGVIVAYNLKAKKKNIGDYIQTLAAIEFANGYDIVYLDRDNLDKYTNEKHLPSIMNGWYMLKPENYPPSEFIDPLYVSFHIAPFKAETFFSPQTIEHLKQYAPIGCRDKNTMRLMLAHGIDAYFSGCLTLTLGHEEQYSDGNRDNNIYIVDPYTDDDLTFNPLAVITRFFRFRYSMYKNKEKINKIAERIAQTTHKYKGKKELIKHAAKIYATYSGIIDDDVLYNAIYEEHILPMKTFSSEKDKFEYARTLLSKYSKAKFVITSRIHCALPCLAFNTPVIFVSARDMERKLKPTRPGGRLEGLLDLFNNVYVKNGKAYLDSKDFQGIKHITMDYDKHNKDSYLLYRNDLIDRCEAFLSKHN